MGLREQLNENPRITTGITVGIIVLVLGWMAWTWLRPAAGGGGTGGGTGSSQQFYTVDDGKKWFADDARKVPPFKKDNQDAVRAIVYKCDGKEFVNHMERYTPAAQKKMEALLAKGTSATSDPMEIDTIRATGMEVKSPGDPTWVKITDPKAQDVIKPKCSGDGADLEIVRP
jgi:hypothetical protein